jgi:hypothetical protein
MLGSRFFGIGNEYMGFAAGMAVVGLGALMQVAPRSGKLAAALGVGLILVAGAPWWGANWGGSFSAACGMVALWLMLSPAKRPAVVVGALAALVAAAMLPAALDLTRPAAERSHIGASMASLLARDVAPLLATLQRKLAMQFWTVAQAPWMLVGPPVTAAVWWALLRRNGPGRHALTGRRNVAAGLLAAVVAGCTAIVVNDTGLVAGSGALIVATGTILYLAGDAIEEAP